MSIKRRLRLVGEQQRAQGDIFSDAVNLANRIEGLSKLYGVSIVVSEQTLSRLPDASQYNQRFLGSLLQCRPAPGTILIGPQAGADDEPRRIQHASDQFQ